MAFIVVEKGNIKDIGKRFSLGENTAAIGRSSNNDNPEIMLHDDYISRKHAEISCQNHCYMLCDLRSTNGTLLDNTRIESGKFYPLKQNSIIGLGISPKGARVLLRFDESQTVTTARIEVMTTNENSPINWIKVNEERREIWVDNRLLSLSRKEYSLMLFLNSRLGKICQRDELILAVWPEVADPGGVSDAAIDQLIHRVRTKIETDPSQPKRLISKKSFGYMLV